jgi:hypothetical protein
MLSEREREREKIIHRERETERKKYLLKQSKCFTEKAIGFIEFSLKQKFITTSHVDYIK